MYSTCYYIIVLIVVLWRYGKLPRLNPSYKINMNRFDQWADVIIDLNEP